MQFQVSPLPEGVSGEAREDAAAPRTSSTPSPPASAGAGALTPAVDGTDPHHPRVEQKEINAWYAYDVGSSAVSSICISGFVPLLLQNAALAHAGFPMVCPNVVTNSTLIGDVFGSGAGGNETSTRGLPSSMYLVKDHYLQPLDKELCDGDWCKGVPDSVSVCLEGDGTTRHRMYVNFGSIAVDPTSYASGAISISILLQVFIFLTLGALADYGSWRKRLLTWTTYLGAFSCMAFIFVTADTWWLGGILTVLTNVFYSTTFIFYNGWLRELSLLSEHMNGLDDKTDAGLRRLEEVMDDISGKGFMYGYFGAFTLLLVSLVFAFVLDASQAYPLICLLSGAWWCLFGSYTLWHLRDRPGPPFPTGQNFLVVSTRNIRNTCSHFRSLPRLALFLACWFFYSDSFNVMGTLGGLFANSEVRWSFSKTLGITVIFVLSPLAAGFGNIAFSRISTQCHLRARHIVQITIAMMACLPLWGLLGFVSTDIGLRTDVEMLLAVAIYGFAIGAVQSFSRSLFSTMVPSGMQSEFFSFFAFTDRASSWLGPLIVSSIQQSNGNVRYAFFYVFFGLTLPCLVLFLLDEDAGVRDARAFRRIVHLEGTEVSEGEVAVDQAGAADAGEGGAGKRRQTASKEVELA